MNYQSTKIINQSLCIGLVTLTTFLSNCKPKELDVSTERSWDGVQDVELKKKFKEFVGGWEKLTYGSFLDRVAQAVENQASHEHLFQRSGKNGGIVKYYIPTEYIPSGDEKIMETLKRGPFYQAAFQQEYSKISGELKKIYDNFLILPNGPVRSRDANLFVVACFLKFTEEVDQALKDTTLDNDALIKQLNELLNDFRSKAQEVDRRSSKYPNKDASKVAMGIVIMPNGEGKITFEKNTVASFPMNERCMISQRLACFIYEQCKEIKTEIDKLDSALKKAAKKAAQAEEHT